MEFQKVQQGSILPAAAVLGTFLSEAWHGMMKEAIFRCHIQEQQLRNGDKGGRLLSVTARRCRRAQNTDAHAQRVNALNLQLSFSFPRKQGGRKKNLILVVDDINFYRVSLVISLSPRQESEEQWLSVNAVRERCSRQWQLSGRSSTLSSLCFMAPPPFSRCCLLRAPKPASS